MILHEPFCISSRLLPALKIGNDYLSIEALRYDHENRTVYRAYLDLADGKEYEINDLRSGCGGGTIQEGMESLLAFLEAAAEAYRYEMSGHKSENSDLFEPEVNEWAYQNGDYIAVLQMELEENLNLVEGA